MAIIRYIDADGTPRFNDSWPAGKRLPAGAVEVSRLPGPFEDFVNGVWVFDARGRADFLAGPEHIAEARALKYLEALLITSGVPLLRGMLADEAVAKGTTVLTLANQVMAKRTQFIAAEVTRQRRQGGAPD